VKSRRRKYLLAIGVALVIVAAVVSVIVFTGGKKAPLPAEASDEERRVSTMVWPAPLLLHVSIDPSQQADQPADVALLGGNMFLVDTGHGRLLEMSADGTSFKVLDSQVDPKLTLSIPLGIASGQGQLYVADSGTGRVLLVAPSGTVNRVITLERGGAADALPPRPIGIVVWGDGSFAISDANNHRLIKYGADGNVLWQVGTGAPATGDTGFNVPAGLALDKDGNVYVVDVLNAKVKKYSSD
jgi:serine/threonine-protein kinase